MVLLFGSISLIFVFLSDYDKIKLIIIVIGKIMPTVWYSAEKAAELILNLL